MIVWEKSRIQEESPGNLDNFFCGCLSCAAGSKYRKEYETEESDLKERLLKITDMCSWIELLAHPTQDIK